MDKVSIIIPVYNVEKYVSECIDSIIKQTYKEIEIIIVNDGSKDSSGEICKKKVEMDNRIIYLEKENGGLSSARNYGLEYATGKFVYFIDSDDYLNENAIKIMMDEQKQADSEIVSTDFLMVSDEPTVWTDDLKLDSLRSNNSLFYLQRITNQACAKLYKRELFEGVSYPIGMHYEDVFTTFRLYDKAQRVSHICCGLYCYRVREGAITYNITERDIEDLWRAFEAIKEHYSIPTNEQIFYGNTVLYTIYSRLLRSDCTHEQFVKHEKRLYKELKFNRLSLFSFWGKSPMAIKMTLFRLHLTKMAVRMIDMKRKILG